MKIELISENKIKIELTNSDLEKRNIQLKELAVGSEKAYSLLREIMETAYYKYNFNIDESPIVIETMQLSTDAIRILITRIQDEGDVENFVKSSKNFDEILKDKIDIFKKLGDEAKNQNLQQQQQKQRDVKPKVKEDLLVFSFDDMDTVAKASIMIKEYNFKSILYKKDEKFFLLLEKNDSDVFDKAKIILNEFGSEHIGSYKSKLFLNEHSKIIIKKDAVEVLSTYLV